jgi:hypothetical protein
VSPRIYTSGRWGPPNYTNASQSSTGLRSEKAKHASVVRLDSIAAYVAAYQAAGYDFVKPYYEGDLVFDSLVAAARRLGMPLAGHIPEHTDTSITVERVLTSGLYRSIEHIDWYTVRTGEGWSLDEGKLAALAGATRRAGVWNMPNLANRIHPCCEKYMPVLRRAVKVLHDSSVGLLLGTDAAQDPFSGITLGLGVHQQLQQLVEAGLAPYQALATGTKNVAQYFGTLDETGTVAMGKRADLVLLAGDPLADIAQARDPVGVMLGGRWLDRAALDRRLLPVSAAPGAVLDDWLRRQVFNVLSWKLTPAQKTALRQLDTTYAARRTALTDSLAPGARAGAERQRMLQLVAAQLGAVRAALPPEQRELWDAMARVWLREHARQGSRVTIAGVAPVAP